MASKLSFLNSLITQRKKPNHNNNNNNTIKDDHINEDLAIVKAAAWAWYQHGSGSSGREDDRSSEFYVTRSTRYAPRPSRYKLELEAMRSMEKGVKQGSSIHDMVKEESLLDAYEVQSISRHLNRIIESNNNHNHNIASTSVDNSVKSTKKKKKMRKGLFTKHGVICGRDEDVVNPTTRRQLTKSVGSGF